MTRKLPSWIDAFIAYTSNTEAPEIARRWTAISALAAVLEQKVWVKTYTELYPNIFAFIVSPPGIGKSQSMDTARKLITAIPKNTPYIAPTSVNVATLVDQMKDSKRSLVGPDLTALEYNYLSVMVGELGTLVGKYEDDFVALLSDFYDVRPYGQRRRGNGGLKIEIERPLLNLIIGVTPSVLMKVLPESAWSQGFTSRIVMVYSDDKGYVDDFAQAETRDPSALIHDLTIINDLVGRFSITDEYQNLVRLWRDPDANNEEPKPTHPRLAHYNTRRKVHLYRLSMIAAIDRGNALVLDRECFNRAIGWLHEAEGRMPMIFKHTATVDTSAMDEVHHFVLRWNLDKKSCVPEHLLVSEMRKKVKATDVLRTLDVMIHSGLLRILDPKAVQGRRQFIAVEPHLQADPGQALLQ